MIGPEVIVVTPPVLEAPGSGNGNSWIVVVPVPVVVVGIVSGSRPGIGGPTLVKASNRVVG